MDKKAPVKQATKEVKLPNRSRSKSPKQEKINTKETKDTKKPSKPVSVCPKRALSAYFIFMGEVREKITAQGIKGKDVGVEAGKMWRGFSDKDKLKFEELHKKDILRYEKEKKDFDEKGFFVNTEGVKVFKTKEEKGKENSKDAKKEKMDKKAPKKGKGKKDSEASDEDDD